MKEQQVKESQIKLVTVITMIMAILVAGILLLNDGQFIYVLDDPYIHLALANNIADGHYGLNPGEFAAPASSIIWPFLFVPSAGWAGQEYLPFLVNAVALMLTALLIQRTFAFRFTTKALRWTVGLLVFLGGITLVFTGMEHSLQLLFAVAIVCSMIDLTENRPLPAWLFVALLVAPFIRYELTGLALGAVLLLCIHRRFIYVFAAVGIIVGLSGFSYFLWQNTGHLLPSSILAKLGGRGQFANLIPLFVLSLLLCVQLYHFRRQRARMWLTLYMLAALWGQILIGRTGWYSRYEVYVGLSSALVLIYYLAENGVATLVKKQSDRVIAKVALFLVTLIYMVPLLGIPGASHAIYAQHVQMQRLIEQADLKSVAINDIGYITYKSDVYVYDMWGLGNYEASRMRYTDDPKLFGTVAQKDIPLVMMYHTFFSSNEIPESWTKLGVLEMGSFPGFIISPLGDPEVRFYTYRPEYVKPLQEQIAVWSQQLPVGAIWRPAE